MTNGEWIRSMNNDELATWLHNICAFVSKDDEPYLSMLDSNGKEIEIHDACGDIVCWLREENTRRNTTTNADKIRNLSDEELADLLAWGEVYAEGLKVPSCDEGCEDCESGCALECPIEKREKNIREWLQEQEE